VAKVQGGTRTEARAWTESSKGGYVPSIQDRI
jgi:hypothetical protein